MTFDQVTQLHRAAIREFGGSNGIRDQNLILSAIAQPHQSFGGVDLYPTPIAKAAALGWSLAKNHGFVDGNKRVGWLATKVALFQLGYHLDCPTDEAEEMMLGIVAGEFDIADFALWIESMVVPVAVDRTSELGDALKRLAVLMEPHIQAIIVYGSTLKSANAQHDFMDICPTLNTKWRQNNILNSVASGASILAQELTLNIEEMQSELHIVEKCAPQLNNWLSLNPQEAKLHAVEQLMFLGRATESIDKTLESADNFQISLEKMATNHPHPQLQVATNLLANAIDDLKFLFNQNWFSFREMLDIAKQKLNES